MGSGHSSHSDGRHLTHRYGPADKEIDYAHYLNKKLKNNGYSTEPFMRDANRKARKFGLISDESYYKHDKANKAANIAKHQWN